MNTCINYGWVPGASPIDRPEALNVALSNNFRIAFRPLSLSHGATEPLDCLLENIVPAFPSDYSKLRGRNFWKSNRISCEVSLIRMSYDLEMQALCGGDLRGNIGLLDA